MKRTQKRRYRSELRARAAEETKKTVLAAAKALFSRRGIDRTTVADIARRADVAAPTVYALYKSKEGILRAIMREALFGRSFEEARSRLDGVTEAVERVALSAHVARAIYEQEGVQLGFIRGSSAFSPSLRKLEQEFEQIRLDMQEERIRLLFAQSRQREGLSINDARRILWMYTSRDIYRMLVHEGGWTPEQFQHWLSETLVTALTNERR
ncbi:MAG TPA: helix-turn-helix domain-containing protein [Burkholderiales bacterium]|nr:helix-turn-helix domain-containing protein [Burkholderiales bacterium]